MTSSEAEIIDVYNKTESIKGTAKETGYSWGKIVKTLSSNGYILNNDHEKILELNKKGLKPPEIAKIVGCSIGKVENYLPRVRPIYLENRSKNALRIAKCREGGNK